MPLVELDLGNFCLLLLTPLFFASSRRNRCSRSIVDWFLWKLLRGEIWGPLEWILRLWEAVCVKKLWPSWVIADHAELTCRFGCETIQMRSEGCLSLLKSHLAYHQALPPSEITTLAFSHFGRGGISWWLNHVAGAVVIGRKFTISPAYLSF